jgi:hypothetical protein
MALSPAQTEVIHRIFARLRPRDVYKPIESRSIADIISNPDGREHRLPTLDRALYFNSEAVRYADNGDVGDAERVFRNVAKVICKSSHPSDWTVMRQTVQTSDGYEDLIEMFSWTHNGIRYDITSDCNGDWFFRGK